MRKNFTHFFAMTMLLLSVNTLSAQTTVFWPTADSSTILASQFADTTQIFKSTTATPTPPAAFKGWTSKGLLSADPAKVNATHWDWKRNGKADKGAFWGTLRALASPTAANGCAVFDSDNLDGNLISPAPHAGELISPIINATGYSNIVVEFNQYFRKFESECYLQYSTDGGATWSRLVNVFPNKDLKTNEVTYNSFTASNTDSTKVKVTLPGSVGTSNFRIKFVFDGDGFSSANPRDRGTYQGYYFWIIDDIKLTNEKYYNVRVDQFYALPPNLYTPKEQLDTVRFLADIRNMGSVPMNNVKLQVNVWRASDGALVYTGTNTQYPTSFGLDTTLENRIITQPLLPAATQQAGRYIGSYRVIGDSSKVDINPANDTIGFQFWVSDTTNANSVVVAGVGKSNFTKENANLTTTRIGNGFWTGTEPRSVRYGVYYRVNKVPATITSLITRFDKSAAVPGRRVQGSLYEWKDANDDGVIQGSERTLVAAADTLISKNQVPFNPDAPSNGWFVFNLLDIATNKFFYPKPKSDYLAVVEFDAPVIATPVDSNYMRFVFNRGSFDYEAMRYVTDSLGSPRYSIILGKTADSEWSTAGFSDGSLTPVIRLNVLPFLLTNTTTVLAGNNKINLSPNPVGKDFLNIEVQLEKASDALFRVMTIEGRLIAEQVLDKFERQNIQLEVNNYPSGTYIVQILTPQGIMTKRFVKTE